MDDYTTLMRLEELADKLGVPIRYEAIKTEEELPASPGGLCRLQGRLLIIVDSRVPVKSKIRVLADALKRFDLDGVYVLPALRELLER